MHHAAVSQQHSVYLARHDRQQADDAPIDSVDEDVGVAAGNQVEQNRLEKLDSRLVLVDLAAKQHRKWVHCRHSAATWAHLIDGQRQACNGFSQQFDA